MDVRSYFCIKKIKLRDLYDFIKIRETNLFGIFISDVSGHGVPAALITSMVKTLVETAGEKRIKPAELLTFMNEKLVDQTGVST